MAVSLPTAARVRKVREQAAKNAAERAEIARTPLLAVLGAGDFAVTTVTKAVTGVRAVATAQAEDVQHRVAQLPNRLHADELRRAAADLRAQAEVTYVGFAERGEKAWGRIRKQPQVRQALSTIETYTEKFDARVDDLVDDAHDVAEKALATVTRQTRSTGEKVARTTQRYSTDAAEAVTDVSKDASEAVAGAGAEVAGTITETGAEVAHDARSASRKAAARTAPKAPKATPKTAARKPATRRNAASDTNGTKTGS
jgi:heparin binding hemagglutinin HbhA